MACNGLEMAPKRPQNAKFPGALPLDPAGGLRTPPDPQFVKRPPAAFGHRAVVFAAKELSLGSFQVKPS